MIPEHIADGASIQDLAMMKMGRIDKSIDEKWPTLDQFGQGFLKKAKARRGVKMVLADLKRSANFDKNKYHLYWASSD